MLGRRLLEQRPQWGHWHVPHAHWPHAHWPHMHVPHVHWPHMHVPVDFEALAKATAAAALEGVNKAAAVERDAKAAIAEAANKAATAVAEAAEKAAAAAREIAEKAAAAALEVIEKNNERAWSSCRSSSAGRSHGCEGHGLLVYPRCKPGWHNVACCICAGDAPDCSGLGLGGGFLGSCAKKIKIGEAFPLEFTLD